MTLILAAVDGGSTPPASTSYKITMIKLTFHRFIRWALGIHGAIHIVETLLNIYEQAYMSALMSLLAGMLMIAGACIDSAHHKEENE